MKLYTNLDIWGWMNCDTDQIANNFCLQMESGEVRPIQEGFFESSANVSLIVNAVCLHIQWSKQEKFLQDKHGWSDKAWNSINWKDFKGAFLSLGPLKCIKTSKSIHSWLNTGHWKSKISPDAIDSHHCPRCLQPTENQEHILNCLNPCANKCRYELVYPMMTKIIQNPGCRVQQVFELYVRSWLADLEPPTLDISQVPIEQQDLLVWALEEQDLIGWDLGMRGYSSQHWGLASVAHPRLDPKNDKGKAWT
jgi:hypothetical protein